MKIILRIEIENVLIVAFVSQDDSLKKTFWFSIVLLLHQNVHSTHTGYIQYKQHKLFNLTSLETVFSAFAAIQFSVASHYLQYIGKG